MFKLNRDSSNKSTPSPFLSSCRRIGLSRSKKSFTSSDLNPLKCFLEDAIEPANSVDLEDESKSISDYNNDTAANVNKRKCRDSYHSNSIDLDKNDVKDKDEGFKRKGGIDECAKKPKISRGLKTLSKDIDIKAVKLGRFNTQDFLEKIDLNSLEEKCLNNENISEDVKQFISLQKNEESTINVWERKGEKSNSTNETKMDKNVEISSDCLSTESSIDEDGGIQLNPSVNALKKERDECKRKLLTSKLKKCSEYDEETTDSDLKIDGNKFVSNLNQNIVQNKSFTSSQKKIAENYEDIAVIVVDSGSSTYFSEETDSDSDFEQFSKKDWTRDSKVRQSKLKSYKKPTSDKGKSQERPKNCIKKLSPVPEKRFLEIANKMTTLSDDSEEDVFCKKETKKRKLFGRRRI